MKSLLYVVGLLVLVGVVAGCGGGGGGGFSSLGDSYGSASGLVGGDTGGGSGDPIVLSHNPEPSSLMLMATGLLGFVGFYFRKFRG
jgi:hypothetical protein